MVVSGASARLTRQGQAAGPFIETPPKLSFASRADRSSSIRDSRSTSQAFAHGSARGQNQLSASGLPRSLIDNYIVNANLVAGISLYLRVRGSVFGSNPKASPRTLQAGERQVRTARRLSQGNTTKPTILTVWQPIQPPDNETLGPIFIDTRDNTRDAKSRDPIRS